MDIPRKTEEYLKEFENEFNLLDEEKLVKCQNYCQGKRKLYK
jgi:hypothetical protein